ncbi:MAG: hypothetical protein GC192_07150 [Bacteroidetes bacterium]|nr:hypothetical protein [Bacteroidota bacterium]
MTVNIGSSPTATVSVSSNACIGSATLTATGGSSFLWSTGETTASIGTTTNGNYSVTVSNANGCTDTASTTVSIPTAPQIQVTGPTNLCSGNVATLDATSGFTSYIWSNGATTPSISANQPNTYSVTATDANGCTSTSYLQPELFSFTNGKHQRPYHVLHR